MVNLPKSIVAILLTKSTQATEVPPKEGKFFYTDFDQKGTYGLHGVATQVAGIDYNLFVSTNEYSLGLISKDCSDESCVVPKKYDLSKSDTYRSIPGAKETKTKIVEVFDDEHLLLQDAYFDGASAQEDLELTLGEFNRATSLEGLNFLKIEKFKGNTRKFISSYSGFIGIAPWTQKPEDKENNFLYSLKKKGLIDNMTVSFFVENDNIPNKSTIKFGSYDQIGLRPGKDLQMMRTAHKGTWDLKCNMVKIGKEKIAEKANIRFEPQLPYLYLPKDYYRAFVDSINKLYEDPNVYGKKVCIMNENLCRFDVPCKKVPKKKIEFAIRLYDAERALYFNINWKYMYLGGEHFGGNNDECYIPVFSNRRQRDSDVDLVYVGNMFMQSYYMVFDASTLDKGLNYVQVGIGLRNWDAYA